MIGVVVAALLLHHVIVLGHVVVCVFVLVVLVGNVNVFVFCLFVCMTSSWLMLHLTRFVVPRVILPCCSSLSSS